MNKMNIRNPVVGEAKHKDFAEQQPRRKFGFDSPAFLLSYKQITKKN